MSVFNRARWPGTKFDWPFAILAPILVCAGYLDAWQIRHPPVHLWAHPASQGPWLPVTLYLAAVRTRNWLRHHRYATITPNEHQLSALGSVLFSVALLICP